MGLQLVLREAREGTRERAPTCDAGDLAHHRSRCAVLASTALLAASADRRSVLIWVRGTSMPFQLGWTTFLTAALIPGLMVR